MSAGQFHIGPQGPGRCEATVGVCPYGKGGENHFDTYEAAESDFARRMEFAGVSGFRTETKTSPKKANALVNKRISEAIKHDSDLLVRGIEQKQLIQKLSANNELISDADFEERAAYVEDVTARMKALGYETHNLYTKKIGKQSVYTEARLKLHKEIMEHFEDKVAKVPKGRKAYVAGGLGGAGKGSILSELEISKNYATINPDDVKEYMASRGLVPEVEGLTQMEASTLIHEEASDISQKLLQRYMAEGRNVNLDTTLGGLASGRRKILSLKDSEYKVRGVFVDIDVKTSAERANMRYRRGIDNFTSSGGKGIGGRPVPKGVNHAATDSHYNSQNAENFAQLFKEGHFDATPKVFNNMGSGPKIVMFKEFAK